MLAQGEDSPCEIRSQTGFLGPIIVVLLTVKIIAPIERGQLLVAEPDIRAGQSTGAATQQTEMGLGPSVPPQARQDSGCEDTPADLPAGRFPQRLHAAANS